MLNISLQRYRKKHFSQCGEDGALQFILATLQRNAPLSHFFVEFGAWDGKHLSNTYALANQHRFGGVYIEGARDRYEVLKQNFANNQLVRCVNRFIEIEGNNSLDSVLTECATPNDFDLLSIDIDGNDYHVWKSLTSFSPKVVVIEMNIRIKPGNAMVNPVSAPFEWGKSGSSITSLYELGTAKGYALIGCIGCNGFFLRSDLVEASGFTPLTPSKCFTYEGHSIGELGLGQIVQKLGFRLIRGSKGARLDSQSP